MLETLKPNNNHLLPLLEPPSTDEKAQKIKQLLIELACLDDEYLKSECRLTAEFFCESFFSLTEKQIGERVTETLRDHFNGEEYRALKIDNLAKLTSITTGKPLPVLGNLVKQGLPLEDRCRRWQEFGERYNPIYKLNMKKPDVLPFRKRQI